MLEKIKNFIKRILTALDNLFPVETESEKAYIEYLKENGCETVTVEITSEPYPPLVATNTDDAMFIPNYYGKMHLLRLIGVAKSGKHFVFKRTKLILFSMVDKIDDLNEKQCAYDLYLKSLAISRKIKKAIPQISIADPSEKKDFLFYTA